jgi:hypothetical protein
MLVHEISVLFAPTDVRMHKQTYEAYKDMIKVGINYYNLFKYYKIEK